MVRAIRYFDSVRSVGGISFFRIDVFWAQVIEIGNGKSPDLITSLENNCPGSLVITIP